MGYGGWGRWSESQPRSVEFCERGWQRKPLADWDARWQCLSVPAWSAMLVDVKATPQGYGAGSPDAGTAVDRFRPEVVKEPVDAGFVRVIPSANKKPDRLVAVDEVTGFRRGSGPSTASAF